MELELALDNPIPHLQEGGLLIEDTARPAADILAEQAAQGSSPALFVP